jgi:pimeloyl-ACP methyl ester carboxylesterase
MPQAELIRMPGVGHLPMIERPQECAADYLRFRAQARAG